MFGIWWGLKLVMVHWLYTTQSYSNYYNLTRLVAQSLPDYAANELTSYCYTYYLTYRFTVLNYLKQVYVFDANGDYRDLPWPSTFAIDVVIKSTPGNL